MGIGVCAHSQRICLRGTQSRGTFNGRLRELSAWGVSIRPWAKFVPPWRHSALEGGLPSPAAGFESCYVSFCGAQIFHQSFPGRWFLGLRPLLSPWVTRQGGIRLVNQEAYIWSACQPRAKGKGRTLGLHVVNSTSSSGSTNAEDPCPMSTIARRYRRPQAQARPDLGAAAGNVQALARGPRNAMARAGTSGRNLISLLVAVALAVDNRRL